MKGIQKKVCKDGQWDWMGPMYTGLPVAGAKTTLAMLRRWAREDNSGAYYRIVDEETIWEERRVTK